MNANPVPRFVSYLRVSTDQQGRSGLGLEGQRDAVVRHVASVGGRIVAELVEVESGRKNDRPKLAAALEACRRHRAVLAIAKLDRLARNVAFVSNLMESGVEFVAADMPILNRLTVHILAAVAEEEARMISARTKAALAAAKARGVKLGGYRVGSADIASYSREGQAAGVAVRREAAAQHAMDLEPTIRALQGQGITSLSAMARELTARGVPTLRGSSNWQAVQVARVMERLEAA